MLVVPVLDLFYTFDSSTQETVVESQSWAVWISAAMQAYLILFNHDLFYGDFATKFGLEPSPFLATTIFTSTIVGLVFIASLMTFTVIVQIELKQSSNAVIDKFTDV